MIPRPQTSLPLFDLPREPQVRRAAENAEAVSPGWNAEAERFTLAYAARGPFTGEDVTHAAKGVIPDPPHGAWGSVIRRLATAKKIVQTGNYAKRENGNPTPLWCLANGGG